MTRHCFLLLYSLLMITVFSNTAFADGVINTSVGIILECDIHQSSCCGTTKQTCVKNDCDTHCQHQTNGQFALLLSPFHLYTKALSDKSFITMIQSPLFFQQPLLKPPIHLVI